MKPNDRPIYLAVKRKLTQYNSYPTPGIQDAVALDCLARQIVDSTRRIKYVSTILGKQHDASVADATSDAFHPLKAAVWHLQQGNNDEAFWLVFLFTHFGKNANTGWRLLRAIYGGLRDPAYWDWNRVSADPISFCTWLTNNIAALKAAGGFGNHRKYESLLPRKAKGTCDAVTSYVNWIGPSRSHIALFAATSALVGNNPKTMFNYLYHSMNSVHRFGRTAKFDYLTMLGKLGLVSIEPDSTYIDEATGPLRGANLLFGGNTEAGLSTIMLSDAILELQNALGLSYGMQIIEDSLCNWQKSPYTYLHFSA